MTDNAQLRKAVAATIAKHAPSVASPQKLADKIMDTIRDRILDSVRNPPAERAQRSRADVRRGVNP